MLVVRLLKLLSIIVICIGCNTKDQNFDFDPEQLGKVSFPSGNLDFGSVPIGFTHERLIEIENTGKLPISDFETEFDNEEFSIIFRYSGQDAQFPGENGNCGEVLQPAARCFLSISYSPSTSTTQDVNFKLRYKDGLGISESSIQITSLSGVAGNLEITPDIMSFGDIDFNDQKTILMTFTNSGDLEISELSFVLEQNGESLYSLDFSDTQSTCSALGQKLQSEQSCIIAVKVDSSVISVYDDYVAYVETTYIDAPTATNTKLIRTDLRTGVYSLEGVLEVTELLRYQNVITGSQKNMSFQVRNIGHNSAVIKSVNSLADPNLQFSINTSDCTNLSDEIELAPGEMIIPVDTICIFNAQISPVSNLATQAFNYTDLNITYDNLKTGLVNTSDFELDVNVIQSGYISITDQLDVNASNWAIPSTIISNDSRISQSQTFKVKHNGETPITFQGFELTGQANEYLSISEACPPVLDVGQECNFTLILNPTLDIYSSISEVLINSNLKITYTNEAIDIDNNFIQSEIDFGASGNLDLKSFLVFDEFDSGASLTNESVATSAILQKIYVRNIGGLDESLFSLNIGNTTNFSTSVTSLTDSEGERNCLDLIANSESLSPQQLCFYEIRGYSPVMGNVSTTLDISFSAPVEISSNFDLDIDFVDVAKIATVNVSDKDKSSYITYIADYPGVGSVTSSTDVLVSRQFSSNTSVASSQITTHSIITNFDLAIIDGGYGEVGTQEVLSFSLGNTGEFPLGINDINITQIYDETNSLVLTSGASLKSVSSCRTGANITNGGECQASFDIDYTNTSLIRVDVEVKYTLGDKANPDDANFIEYTSYVQMYVEGYNAASVAHLNIYEGALEVSEVNISETAGPENEASRIVRIQNDSSFNATDIHYALALNGNIITLNGSSSEEIAFPDFVAGANPIDEYLINNTATCNNASGNDILSGGDCSFNINFRPKSFGETEHSIIYRYFNGVTYVSNQFTLNTDGLTPAKLELSNVLGAFPFYNHDFEGQVIDQSYTHEVAITNTGETDALNFSHDLSGGSFEFVDNSTSLPTCGLILNSGETCYLNLIFNPVFSNIGNIENRNFLANYDTGEIVSGSSLIQTIELNAIGLSENIRSAHYGWSEIYSIGYNEAYALELNNLGNNYDPEDLGYVSFSWFSMDDLNGVVDRYLIFKSDENNIDIYNDTPYAIINSDGSSVYSYEDKSILNTPLKVWFYKIVPEKNGAISQILESDYPVSILRIVIPNKFETLVHKYVMNREICKKMNFTDTTMSNFDPKSNGCDYTDKNSAIQTVNFNYDFTVDMFESSSDYINGNSNINLPQGTPVENTFASMLEHCQSKEVTYSSVDNLFVDPISKSLPNVREHSVYASKIEGENYDASNCLYDQVDPLTGNAVDCQSKFLVEQGVGGLNEWSLSEVGGDGRGKSTNYGGFIDTSINNIDYKKHFQFISGLNFKNLLDSTSLANTCYNVVTGIVEREGALGCIGENYSTFTDDSALAGPKVIDISDEQINTRFGLWFFNTDLEEQGLTVNALVGGGESSSLSEQNNSSIYTVEFTPGVSPRGAGRCISRIGY